MPHFRLETNLPADKIPADLPAKLCKVLASSLGKPINVGLFEVLFLFSPLTVVARLQFVFSIVLLR